MGSTAPLDRGPKSVSSKERNGKLSPVTAAEFLCILSSWFTSRDKRKLGRKIATEAALRLPTIGNAMDFHFAVHELVKFWNTCKKEWPDSTERLEWACRQQISVAAKAIVQIRKDNRRLGDSSFIPCHEGYERLCKLLSEQGRLAELKAIASQAKKQNWAGDWNAWIKKSESPISIH